MNRRDFVRTAASGAAACALPGAAAGAQVGARPPMALMKVGTQHGDVDMLRRCASTAKSATTA